MLGGCVRVKRECYTVSTAFKNTLHVMDRGRVRLLGGCVRVKRECNTALKHTLHILDRGRV